jgi:hypothetical protein
MRTYYTKRVSGRGMCMTRTKTGSGFKRMFRDKREGLGKVKDHMEEKLEPYKKMATSAMKKFNTLSLDENINKPKKYISLNF